MANEYTPTVWQTGDVITAEKLNKIENGIAGASGQGISIATVTLVTGENTYLFGDYVGIGKFPQWSDEYSDPPFEQFDALLPYGLSMEEVGQSSVDVLLYDGIGYIKIVEWEGYITVTGNGERIVDQEHDVNYIKLTGDCTITSSSTPA